MTYGIMEIMYLLLPCIPLHLKWTTNIIPFQLLYDQHVATFISTCYRDLYVTVVLGVAYYQPNWILLHSLVVALYQNNIILSLLCSWYIWRMVELTFDICYDVK